MKPSRVIASTDLQVNNAPLTGESRHTSATAATVAAGRLVDAVELLSRGQA